MIYQTLLFQNVAPIASLLCCPQILTSLRLNDTAQQQVTLMPQEGETFAGALDSLEARCRSETRLLYESEGKEELLGESGVPESLRVWLEESRGRALGDGGHRERARRRLREQVRGHRRPQQQLSKIAVN